MLAIDAIAQEGEDVVDEEGNVISLYDELGNPIDLTGRRLRIKNWKKDIPANSSCK